jgi:hypothetical protein
LRKRKKALRDPRQQWFPLANASRVHANMRRKLDAAALERMFGRR